MGTSKAGQGSEVKLPTETGNLMGNLPQIKRNIEAALNEDELPVPARNPDGAIITQHSEGKRFQARGNCRAVILINLSVER